MTGGDYRELLPDFDWSPLRREAYRTKLERRGPEVYFRGLIELSNVCRKDCLYCGIRRSNAHVVRYALSDDQVLQKAEYALSAGYGSIAIQSGERTDSAFTERISRLLYRIRSLPRPDGGEPLHVTLSLGEQSREVYREWFRAGASRYLLRIEASVPALYGKLHPKTPEHAYDARKAALEDLKAEGYLLGSGMMIGLPYQTCRDLDADLRFLKQIGVDMVGMGPYIVHRETPLGQDCLKDGFCSRSGAGDFCGMGPRELLGLSLDMVARLRLLMPHINIAATTALQVLHPLGREMALLSGANVIMPNITDSGYREDYSLYEGKAGVRDDAAAAGSSLLDHLAALEIPVGWCKSGDWRKIIR